MKRIGQLRMGLSKTGGGGATPPPPVLTGPATVSAQRLDDGNSSRSFPHTISYTPTAGTRGVFLFLTGVANDYTVTVNGVQADVIESMGADRTPSGTPPSEGLNYLGVFYAPITSGAAQDVVISRALSPTVGTQEIGVSAVEVQNYTVRSIKAHSDNFEQPLATNFLFGTMAGMDWDAGDVIIDYCLGENNPTYLSGSTEITDINAGFGTLTSSVGTEIAAAAGANQTREVRSRGFRLSYAAGSIVASVAQSPSIRIDGRPHNWVYARSFGGTTGDVPVSGTVYNASTVQVRVVNYLTGAEVLTWQSMTVSGGTWSGTLVGVPVGTNYRFQMRTGAGGDVFAAAPKFSVGIVVLMYGQSNMAFMSSTQYAVGVPWADPRPFGTVVVSSDPDEYPAPNRPGERKLLTALFAQGLPVMAYNGGLSSAGIFALSKGQPHYDDKVIANLQQMGQPVEVMVWTQGENDAVGGNDAYAAQLEQLRSDIETDLGQSAGSLQVFVSSLSHSNTGGSDTAWTSINDEILEATTTYANIRFSHPLHDMTRTDGFHFNGEGYEASADRFAYSVALWDGRETVDHQFTITSGTVVNSSTFRVTVDHGLGTDFTPTTGIAGFEVSDDNGSTWASVTGSRNSATTIDLDTSGVNGAVTHFRYAFGTDPFGVGASGAPSGVVVDNGALNMPLRWVTEMAAS